MANSVLHAGDRAPAFTLPSDDGSRLRLTEHRGRWVVLYFYPKDFTPGCTTQACDFQEVLGDFEDAGAMVVGISPDSVESHAEFRDHCGIEFPLLHDRDAKIASRYGVWREKRHRGRSYLGIVRSTLLLDPSGRVVQVWDNVRVRGHADKVLTWLRRELER